MHDHTFTIILGIFAALVAILLRNPRGTRQTRRAQQRANTATDDKANAATVRAENDHKKAVAEAQSQTQHIDRASLNDLAKMVDHEYGSD